MKLDGIINKVSGIQAIPPQYQESREKEAILREIRHNEELREKFLGNDTLSIEKTEFGYLVSTDSYSLEVKVNYLPQDILGPAKFELVFGEALPVENYTF